MNSLVVAPDVPGGCPERRKEWIVANGLGGYASGPMFGAATRRFHGLLIAAMPAPLGRMTMLNKLTDSIRHQGASYRDLMSFEPVEELVAPVDGNVACGRLDLGLPVWTFRNQRMTLEKRISLRRWQNTTQISYRLLEAREAIRIRLRPWLHIRPHEGRLIAEQTQGIQVNVSGARCEFHAPALPAVRMSVEAEGAALVLDADQVELVEYDLERSRGYDYQERLWSPGYFRVQLNPGRSATLVVSTEPWEDITTVASTAALEAEQHRRARLLHQASSAIAGSDVEPLVFAADQFLVRPATRRGDTASAQFAGEEARTIIAGYHWFTDWGRDAMIALEGLTLATGRCIEARDLLKTFVRYVRDGLLPNNFPEGDDQAVYHTADATLWYFHALARYVAATQDWNLVAEVLPALRQVIERHLSGTHFGIYADPTDGLLVQGAAAHPLTWMDAKAGDWIVTPRRGKAVEINALWYNALCCMAQWLPPEDSFHHLARGHADLVWKSFNDRFWIPDNGPLFDVIDGDSGENDWSMRPNQIFAISLDHPVLERSRWTHVVQSVKSELLTPYGLRTLNRSHPDYRATYDGDVRSRDAAYHQGSVWPWLLGHFIDAWLRVFPDRKDEAAEYVAMFTRQAQAACVGTICELYDGEPPYLPRGCASQAWSVAEVLRAWLRTR